MLKAKIERSIIADIKILFLTLRKKNWLDKKGYNYFLFDKKVFSKVDYEKISQEIRYGLDKYSKALIDVIDTNKDYKIYLTRFGTFGSYEAPDKVFVNVFQDLSQIVETVIHELVHLEFESEVVKKGMSHEEKEKLIDSIVDGILKK